MKSRALTPEPLAAVESNIVEMLPATGAPSMAIEMQRAGG